MVSTMSDGWKFEQVMNRSPWKSSDHRDHSLTLILPDSLCGTFLMPALPLRLLCAMSSTSSVWSSTAECSLPTHKHQGLTGLCPPRGLAGLTGCICVCCAQTLLESHQRVGQEQMSPWQSLPLVSLACDPRKTVHWKVAVTISGSVNWVASFGTKCLFLCSHVTSGWRRLFSQNLQTLSPPAL